MKKWIVIVGSMLLATSLQAQALTKLCFSCSATEMNQMAWDSVTEMASGGPLYTVDLRNGIVRKYEYRNNVTGDWNPEFDPFEQWAEEVAVEPNISAGVSEVGGYMRAASTENIILPDGTPGMPGDVFDAVQHSSFDDDVAYFIDTTSARSWFNRASDALQIIQGTFFNPNAIKVYVKISWQDGTNAMYGWDPIQKTWVRIPNTARDGRGNLIPELPEQVAGKKYTFPNAVIPGSDAADDYHDMWDHIRNLGIKVIDATDGVGSCGYRMTCTPDGCHVYIQAC